MLKDVYIDKKVYRIVDWFDNPRQSTPYFVISSNYDGGYWKEVKGFNTEEEAIKFIDTMKNKEV